MMNNQDHLNNDSTSVGFYQRFKERRSHVKERFPRFYFISKIGLGLFAFGIASIILLCLLVRFWCIWAFANGDRIKNIHNDNASEIYAVDGSLIGKYYIQNRIDVDYKDISPEIVNALVATEDARFFEHSGIDLRSWMRVFFKSILLQKQGSGGGSTISQQLSKNLYPRKDLWLISTPVNKVREMFIAKRLERVYDKDELLNLYLNTVPFGGNIYGVKVAAKQFFNTSPQKIKTEQAAVLIGMLKANTAYNPVRNPERALKRRNVVLSQMEKYGYLTEGRCDTLKKIPLKLDYQKESHHKGTATYFREHLRHKVEAKLEKLKKPDGSKYNLYTDGLKVYTTIDAQLQNYAEAAVSVQMKQLQKTFDKHWKGKKPWGDDKLIVKKMKASDRYKKLKKNGLSEKAIADNFDKKIKMIVFTHHGEEKKELSPLDSIKYYHCLLNAGFLAMDPQSGHIKSWVGGINHQYFQYDHVKSTRQVGSTFKPIVYTAALQSEVKPCEYIDNHLIIYTEYEDWKPENSNGKYGGSFSLQGGLMNSVNSIAVQLINRIGVDPVIQLAKDMGIKSKIPNVPSIALGAVDISLFDMLQVYSTFANRGKKVDPIYLLRIETNDGKVLLDFEKGKKGKYKQIIEQDYADMMIHMLQGVVDSGTAKRLRYEYNINIPIAGKTGTTQSNADGWFIGFTPNLVVGAWVGADSPNVHFRTTKLGQGANTALPIFALFMQKVLKNKAYSKMKNARFSIPPYHVLYEMECPPFVEELPVEEEYETDEDPFHVSLDKMLNDLKNKKDKKRINVKPGSQERKIEKERKKEERKKKRKKKWDDIFNKNRNN